MNEGTPLVTIQRQKEDEIIQLKDYFPWLKTLSNKWGRLVVIVIVNLVIATNISLIFPYLTVSYTTKEALAQGFSFDVTSVKFINFHKLFMVLGLCILPPNAMLIYRYKLFKVPRIFLKLAHAVILLTSVLFAITGLAIVVKVTIENKSNHFTSIHSWLGLLTLIVFSLQWLVGIFAFLVPTGMALRYKEAIMFFHRFIGLMLVILPTLTACMGLSEVSEFGIDGLELIAKFLAFGLFTQAALVIFFLHGPGSLILKSVQELRTERKSH